MHAGFSHGTQSTFITFGKYDPSGQDVGKAGLVQAPVYIVHS